MLKTQNRAVAGRAAGDICWQDSGKVLQKDFSFNEIEAITGGRLGRHDCPCPSCGPGRKSPLNRKRPVFRVYALSSDFATYCSARCSVKGWARRDGSQTRIDHATLERARDASAKMDADYAARQQAKARWLWSQSVPIGGTIAATYLREARGIPFDPPPTLRFLRPRKLEQHPAMIGSFGVHRGTKRASYAVLRPLDVAGCHLTLLRVDGSGKADTGDMPNKIMLGSSSGWPICLIPPNDNGGLCIAEGIEDALSVHAASGLGSWAAGAAGRLPALADTVPLFVKIVTVLCDADAAGKRGAIELANRLYSRGLKVNVVCLGEVRHAA